jgi:hypothetical protein
MSLHRMCKSSLNNLPTDFCGFFLFLLISGKWIAGTILSWQPPQNYAAPFAAAELTSAPNCWIKMQHPRGRLVKHVSDHPRSIYWVQRHAGCLAQLDLNNVNLEKFLCPYFGALPIFFQSVPSPRHRYAIQSVSSSNFL